MTVERPQLNNVPKRIAFNSKFHMDIQIPRNLERGDIKGTEAFSMIGFQTNPSMIVALIDLGFSSHAFHSSSRLVFMDAQLSKNGKVLTITSPPNNRVYPPGPGA